MNHKNHALYFLYNIIVEHLFIKLILLWVYKSYMNVCMYLDHFKQSTLLSHIVNWNFAFIEQRKS